MTEIEIKARIKNPIKCEKIILELGGKYLKEEHQIDINFGRPIDLDENHMLIEGTFVGRVRQDNSGIRLEFKEARRDGAAREISAPINKISDGEYLFEMLGFRKAFAIEKIRKRYKLGNFEIALDSVTDLGEFIEIEHVSKTGDNIEEILNQCEALLRKIDNDAVVERLKYGDLMQQLINKKTTV